MATLTKGKANIVARPRLMLLLGEQLITDEIAAVSELVKNSYDADATTVSVKLYDVSQKSGSITIKDNGHGMTPNTVVSSWLELGTSFKARDKPKVVRFSEVRKRIYLGEKGLGRLAVHKLGNITELVTRRINSNEELKLTIDWSIFADTEKQLNDIPIEYEITEPRVFIDKDFSCGTQITIKNLQREWTREMIIKTQKSLIAMKSPFADFSDFNIDVEISDKESPTFEKFDFTDVVKKATYKFEAEVDETGKIEYWYDFRRPDLSLKKQEHRIIDIRDPEVFTSDRMPICGPFIIRLYCWDLSLPDQRAVFGDAATYKDFIRPNSGIKVFRDGFRVLPYGNFDNDWLSMDMKRVKRFEKNLSRNQVLGAIEISLARNPELQDKTDREGLIDNDAFRDFYSLILNAVGTFEDARIPDKRKVKELTGRLRDETAVRTVFSKNMAAIQNIVSNDSSIDASSKLEVTKLVNEARSALGSILAEREQPLLVAASIGLTYMMPTHEARRELHEAMKLVRKGIDNKTLQETSARPILLLLRQADQTIQGIGRLMQQTKDDEIFSLDIPIDDAIELMNFRCERNFIKIEKDIKIDLKVKGSPRLVTIVLLNFIDNSMYWLLRNKPEDRKIKIIADCIGGRPAVIVSDNGPGFIDEISTVTIPFFTRKPHGMGLGLYISERMTKMNGGSLKILETNDLPNLYSGANIAIIFKSMEDF